VIFPRAYAWVILLMIGEAAILCSAAVPAAVPATRQGGDEIRQFLLGHQLCRGESRYVQIDFALSLSLITRFLDAERGPSPQEVAESPRFFAVLAP
jgi:hypothetical protein